MFLNLHLLNIYMFEHKILIYSFFTKCQVFTDGLPLETMTTVRFNTVSAVSSLRSLKKDGHFSLHIINRRFTLPKGFIKHYLQKKG